MSDAPNRHLAGLNQLTIEAITRLTDLIASLHGTIATGSGLLGKQSKPKGITGFVYKNVHSITQRVGNGIDLFLEQLTLNLEEDLPITGKEAAVSALNGILGDHLVVRNNPLAIPMQFRQRGRPLDDEDLSQLSQKHDGRFLILVHGLCMNDLQWQRKAHDHGALLAEALGLAPIYLHYNTGRHISENGLDFSKQLQRLQQCSEVPLSLSIVAHSMGGLVSRSACYDAEQTSKPWLQCLKNLVFLGTPHHGAVLEKSGNWLGALLKVSPYSAPFSKLTKIRSAGITDLRYGNLLDEDWQGMDRFNLLGDRRKPVPLAKGVQCYAIAGTTAKGQSHLGDHLLGDGLVSLNSALGRHEHPQRQLLFKKDQQWIARDTGHLDLLCKLEVYKKIKAWLEA